MEAAPKPKVYAEMQDIDPRFRRSGRPVTMREALRHPAFRQYVEFDPIADGLVRRPQTPGRHRKDG